MEPEWVCRKCACPLILRKVVFEYLGHTMSHELPCCPTCGQPLIDADLADGRMASVERELEDK